MSKPDPKEFRDDVVRVARNREPGVELSQIAKDFGIHFTTLYSWMKKADVEDGLKPGMTEDQAAELREVKRRNRLLEQENEVFAQGSCLSLPCESAGKMTYPLVRELAGDGVPVTVTCRVLKLSRQPYYRWLAAPAPTRRRARRGLSRQRVVRRSLRRPGVRVPVLGRGGRRRRRADGSGRTAWRICSQQGWWSAFGKSKRGKAKRPGPPVHDDLCAVVDKHGVIRHEFKATAANELWLSDITEHRTAEGKLYLCAIKDVYSNRIVGYSIDSRMKSRLAVAALNNAVARRGDVAGCVVHTDRGSQFRSRKFVHALNRHAMVGSMGRVGAAGDNAAMESFFALLQKNVLNRRTWATREDLRIAIVTWIERTYHRRRRQDALGRLTPIEYETIMTTPATQAA